MAMLFQAAEATRMMQFKNMMRKELGVGVELPRLATEKEYALDLLVKAKNEGSLTLATIANALFDHLHANGI